MRLLKLAFSVFLGAATLAGCGVLLDGRATIRETRAETSYPPTGKLLTVGGLTVHADIQGQGADLVLIHGASGNSRDFTFSLVDQLKDRYRVITFDRPGMGWSQTAGAAGTTLAGQADILRAAADQLGAEHPIVLGHSYGGSVAMAWALQDPNGPSALVILSGATMPWPGDGLGAWYRIAGSRFGAAAVVPVVTAFAGPRQTDAAMASVFQPAPVPAGYADYFGAELTLRRNTLRTNARQVGTLKAQLQLMVPMYASITQPTELVHGDADTTVPLRIHAAQLAPLLPNAELTVLPGVGHMPHHSNSADVIAAIHRAAARSGQKR